jgi:hypothetical protein
MPPRDSSAEASKQQEHDFDTEYDIVDPAEVAEPDDDQLAREGQLRQTMEPSDTGRSYLASLSNLLTTGGFTENSLTSHKHASAQTGNRNLVTHNSITTLDPELRKLLSQQSTPPALSRNGKFFADTNFPHAVAKWAKSIIRRTAKNSEALGDLLLRVPDGQTDLQEQIKALFDQEQKIAKEAAMMEDFAKHVKAGDYAIKNGHWARRGKKPET